MPLHLDPHPPRPRLDSVRPACRLRHYTIRTEAARIAGIEKPVSSHAFRHSFETHTLERVADIRTAQQLLGHKDVCTMENYTHVLNRGVRGVVSPLDSLA